MTKHTPGPWEIGETARDCILGRNGCRFTICVMQNTHRPEQKANARLIAAAPELLEACLAAVDDLEWHQAQDAEMSECDPEEVAGIGSLEFLRAAIAKAIGGGA